MESKNASFSVGDLVTGFFGWATHTISAGMTQPVANQIPVMKLDPTIYKSPSIALGVLGMPG